ncbi:hypothetical protein [Guptibacillus algicola]|uniref:hypothetical protein n=1 Tax=Guptibacillus algicola TaxID=225844 RepID=UPI001CD5B94B|nr:hypothetical protein [Alkalihalobacillus algicola]MCA0987507.1 hypothetical protein [Alkalihalobacillus algicola]
MRNFLAVILSGFVSSLVIADTFSNGPYSTFGSGLFLGYSFIYPGLLIVAFPFSFLINKLANRFELGRFFIGFGMYMVLASIVTIVLFPVLFHFSFIVLLVATIYPVMFEITKLLPDRFLGKASWISAGFAFLLPFFF